MKRYITPLLLLMLGITLYAQGAPVEDGALLTVGKTASLGVEATTAFAWDIDNNSTGLETKAGMELIFPLFPSADRGLYPDNFDDPAVRLALKNASFTWWNIFQTRGGNYEQDNFNSWSARPLVLTFDMFAADLVWKNYFFRVASSTTIMQTDQTSLISIFDEVMDAGDRWYIRRRQTQALWPNERYNIQQLPILKDRIERDYIDDDYRSAVSGILALGVEFDWISAAVKTASYKNGKENNDNAWLLGADVEVVPLENFRVGLTGFAGFNYETNEDLALAGKNPVNFGLSAEYRLPFSDRYILAPKAGFDFAMDTEAEENAWELGAGVLFYTRGMDSLTSSRVLDWDNVIPVGASAAMSLDNNTSFNLLMSWFEPAGADSMLPNFGGFLQLELADLLGKNDGPDYAVLAQVEYILAGKFTPYFRGGFMPEFSSSSTTETTGNKLVKTALGCYMTPVHFFSIDLRYELDTVLLDGGGSETGKGLFSVAFTIRM